METLDHSALLSEFSEMSSGEVGSWRCKLKRRNVPLKGKAPNRHILGAAHTEKGWSESCGNMHTWVVNEGKVVGDPAPW